eukprot:15094548-Alexandrium_andersonii.AAC.1
MHTLPSNPKPGNLTQFVRCAPQPVCGLPDLGLRAGTRRNCNARAKEDTVTLSCASAGRQQPKTGRCLARGRCNKASSRPAHHMFISSLRKSVSMRCH